MSVFRLQNKIPQVYTEESRDFQTFCRVMDTLHGGIMYDISSMQNLTRPLKINDSLLGLYSTKVGFFTNRDIDAKVLRYILAAFPYIIRYKGTLLGVEMATLAVLKAENSPVGATDPLVFSQDYCIYVYTPFKIINKRALEEVLKYVIPAGYDYKISSRVITDATITSIGQANLVSTATLTWEDSGLRSSSDIPTISGETNDVRNLLSGAYNANTVVSASDITHEASNE